MFPTGSERDTALCPRCGLAFACGAQAWRSAGTPCRCCAPLQLDGEARARLQAGGWHGCLCAGCLAALRSPGSAVRPLADPAAGSA
jgi:hypothetical protein